jgi:arylsulfatase A-like enzyme
MLTKRRAGDSGARQGWRASTVRIVGVAAVAALAWQAVEHGDALLRRAPSGDPTRVADRIRLEHVVANLSATFDRSAVVEESSGTAVRVGQLQPRDRLHSGHRSAILTPPGSRLRFRHRTPARAALRFGVGVEGQGRRDRSAPGVRFRVHVDGEERFTQVVNPAATRHDRRWFDARVDLGVEAEREVVIELDTEADGDAAGAGTPGWSELRIVQEHYRDRQSGDRQTPNVLILLVDTLRVDVLGCYGAAPSPTPALDALARRGLVFDQVIAQSSWTLPAVASIFTGLPPLSHGVVGDPGQPGTEGGGDGASAYLPDTLPTLAAHALAAGVTTVGVTGNSLVSRETNVARGFETFVDLGATSGRAGWPPARDINAVFLQWLQANKEHRFLAYLHYMDLHEPYRPARDLRPAPPDAIRARVARGEASTLYRMVAAGAIPPLSDPEVTYLRALYTAQASSWDRELAVLLRALAEAGVQDSTVLIVLSDHGEEFLEHGRLGHSKSLYDELLRVPLLVIGPGIEAGRVAEQVQAIDLFPTVVALLGLEVPPGLPGRDLLGPRESRPAISETVRGVAPDGTVTRIVSLRTPGWKLIHMPAFELFHLYDLASDPGERENRFGAAPEGNELASLLAEWERNVRPAPEAVGSDPRFHEKLRALGYVQ